jgi:hypothetical protein
MNKKYNSENQLFDGFCICDTLYGYALYGGFIRVSAIVKSQIIMFDVRKNEEAD